MGNDTGRLLGGRPVSFKTPAAGDAPIWSGVSKEWVPASPSTPTFGEYVKFSDTSGWQTVPNAVETLLSFDVEEHTNASYITEPGPYTRLTADASHVGIHSASAGARFETNGTGSRRLVLKKNGVDFVALEVDAATDGVTELNVKAPEPLSNGDYIEAYVWQDSGGDLRVGVA